MNIKANNPNSMKIAAFVAALMFLIGDFDVLNGLVAGAIAFIVYEFLSKRFAKQAR